MSFHACHRFQTIDVAVPEKRLAIEVDGPEHFTLCGRPVGRTVLRQELLRLAGWVLLVVPVAEWQALPRGERAEYLERKREDAEKKTN